MVKVEPDRGVRKHIEQLVGEEHRLYGQGSLSDDERLPLQEIKVELDQCWDLLRQRRALREFGDDPNQARVRPPGTIENYEQ